MLYQARTYAVQTRGPEFESSRFGGSRKNAGQPDRGKQLVLSASPHIRMHGCKHTNSHAAHTPTHTTRKKGKEKKGNKMYLSLYKKYPSGPIMITKSTQGASTMASGPFYNKLERQDRKSCVWRKLMVGRAAGPSSSFSSCKSQVWPTRPRENRKDGDLEKTEQKGRARYWEAKRRRRD